MSYLLTNQNDFPHIPYPGPGRPQATVKTSGCGPCAALMVLENLTDKRYAMADWIRWVISTGARVSGGTSMNILARAMVRTEPLEYTTTSDERVLAAHIASGGMAVANVGGQRGSWKGLFSTAGHYVTILGRRSDGRLIVGDPDFYRGKFSQGTLGNWRKQYVEVAGELVYVTPEVLHQDTLARTPNYYLFSSAVDDETWDDEDNKEEDMIRYDNLEDLPGWGRGTVEKLVAQGAIQGEGEGRLNLSEDMLRILVILDRVGAFQTD